jgi:hypothetical protein
MLARLEEKLPSGDLWRYEPKLDGFRGLLWRRTASSSQLLSRNLRDRGPWFPEILRAASRLPIGTLVDGEIVICDESGAAEFGRLQERLSTARSRVGELVRDHPAVLVAFDLSRGGRFRTRDLHQRAAEALGETTATYRLGQLRYDLAKLRAKGLVLKVPKTQTYRLTPQGFRICILFLKLFHRVYAPLSAAVLQPLAHDAALPEGCRCDLDHLYAAIDRAVDLLLDHLGFSAAA